MTDREKLIEILRVPIYPHLDADPAEVVADYLLDNGVTFATDNNVGGKCDYCQEDAEGCRKMIGAFSITNPFHGRVWQIETAHCKPRQIFFCPMCGRKLAEPPKGE